MKYQFNIVNWIIDLKKNNINYQLLVNTLKGHLIYRLDGKVYEFKDDENMIIDEEYQVIIWKEWCIPYKE